MDIIGDEDALVHAGGNVLVIAIERYVEIERQKLAFDREREVRQASDGREMRLLYEARTREIQAIAMRLGDMVEKQYHTVR